MYRWSPLSIASTADPMGSRAWTRSNTCTLASGQGSPQQSSTLCRRRLIQTSYHQRASLSLGRMYSGIKFRRAGRASYWSRSDLGRHRGRTGLVERSSRQLGVRRLASRGLRRGWVYCHLREACSLRFWLRMCVGPQLLSLADMTLWRGSPKESYDDLTRGGHAFSGLNWNDSLKRTGSS